MLPTRPASGLTCPSFVFVPQAQQARQTPSQQAQAAQQANEATQPIFFCSRLVLTRVDGVQQCLYDHRLSLLVVVRVDGVKTTSCKMRLVLCGVSWSRTDAFFQPKTWTSDNRQYLKAMLLL